MLLGTIEHKHLNTYENFWRGSKGEVSVSEHYESAPTLPVQVPWSKGKVSVSEHHETFAEMRHALSEYVRTSPVRQDVIVFLNRKIQVPANL